MLEVSRQSTDPQMVNKPGLVEGTKFMGPLKPTTLKHCFAGPANHYYNAPLFSLLCYEKRGKLISARGCIRNLRINMGAFIH